MPNDIFILLAFVIPSLCVILALLFKILFSLSRLETKINEKKFERDNADRLDGNQ
jgi:hypothetical protein